MYHPSRGGVRGGRDQFNWDDVKTDKHRENYIGHSVKAPVGRWQKGKDLTWYAKDTKASASMEELRKSEIQKIKEEEDQAMRELLGLAPKREKRFQGNRLDKHETAELLKRGKSEEELVPDYAKGERIQGLGFAPAPKHSSSNDAFEMKTTLPGRTPPERVKEDDVHEDSPPKENDSHSDDKDAKLKRKLEKKEAKQRRKEEKKESKEKRKHSGGASDRSDRKHARERY